MEPASILQDIFFPRRIARLSYFVRASVCNLLIFAALYCSDFKAQTSVPIALGICAYFLFFVIFPRARDCALPLWCLLLLLFPKIDTPLSLVLLFKKTRIPFIVPPDRAAPPAINAPLHSSP